MSKEKNDDESIPTIARWKPNFRYVKDKMIDVTLNNFTSKDGSITDKESYIDLGNNSSGGSGQEPCYSIPAGEEYDPNNDFSYLNRLDLTIVDIDRYIEDFKHRLENADDALRKQLEDELQQLQDKRDNLAENLDSVEKSE